jgi:uncharacterized membrane protein HdeD (DUF308 family)
MIKLFLRKWWVLLLQGILLIMVSIYIFQNPGVALAGLSIWFGVSVLMAGLLGIASTFAMDKADREDFPLVWSILTAIFGLMILSHVMVTMVFIAIIFGVWMLVTGIRLAVSGWTHRDTGAMGWIVLLAGIVSIVAGVMTIGNIGIGAVGVTTLLGIQVLLSGIALVVLSFVKKAIVGAVRGKIESLK